jgi:nucleoside-triphosphatase THEP1
MNAFQSSLVHEMEGSKMIEGERKRGFPSHSLAKGKRYILENKERKVFVGKYRVFKNMTF